MPKAKQITASQVTAFLAQYQVPVASASSAAGHKELSFSLEKKQFVVRHVISSDYEYHTRWTHTEDAEEAVRAYNAIIL